MTQREETSLKHWSAVVRLPAIAAGIFAIYLVYHITSDAYFLLAIVIIFFLILSLTLWHIRHKLADGQWRGVLNDVMWIAALTGAVYLSVEFWRFEPKDVLTLVVAIVAAFIAYEQTAINKRIAWFTGAQESHSTIRLILDAHERGIPVVWWDPHQEKWDPERLKIPRYGARKHRQVVQLPFVPLFLPESERARGSKDTASKAKPLTKEEISAITKERNRLQRQNRKDRRDRRSD